MVLDEIASDIAYKDWVEQGKLIKLPLTRPDSCSCLQDMIKEGETGIDILVCDKNQIIPANCYREGGTPKDNPEIDVRIVVDPNNCIPTGGLRVNRRVIVYHWNY